MYCPLWQSFGKKDLTSKYDLVVDCTGFHRTYLPRIKNDFFLPTYEYKIQYEDKVPYDDFFVHAFKGMSGYFWYFPLGEKTAHIGAGDYNKNHIVETDKFLKKHGGKIVKTVGRPIRLATPENCMPYSDGNIVGVGESIGTVFPLLGEGIIPSMECADLLVDNVDNIAEYERQVAKHFAIYGTVYDFVRKKIDGKFNPVTQIANHVVQCQIFFQRTMICINFPSCITYFSWTLNQLQTFCTAVPYGFLKIPMRI